VRIVSRDPEALPELRLNFLADRRDTESARTLVRHALELIDGPGFAGNVRGTRI
jgi:hypothetical protein